ncbi:MULTISPECIES: JAB domain-containing protein [Clostridium]|uniref:JAB domain-containing protein n=1 Tax=Clostridium TaxID=1485 RepID=UPI000D70C48C|nr:MULTISPECIES: JAB domain-containing protein [Clostridium]ELC8453219.1 JAB domain-containing protein [Clostridium perfringens]PWX32714.1 DNA repair protein RadC [Clostridium perfringens]USQ64442.1 DNA repair protein RadC [Clostridium sp. 16K-1-R1]HAT4311513.1 JAB domain-containing protein [Clostridium perfringens]
MTRLNIPVVRTKLVKEYDIIFSEDKVYGVEGADNIFDRLIGGSTLEKVSIICLDSKNKVINAAVTNIGTDKKVDIIPSELFRIAILSNANSIIICHNHPTGDLKPSQYDIDITKKIGYIGSILGIKLIDSLILGDNGECFSIRSQVNKNGVL